MSSSFPNSNNQSNLLNNNSSSLFSQNQSLLQNFNNNIIFNGTLMEEKTGTANFMSITSKNEYLYALKMNN